MRINKKDYVDKAEQVIKDLIKDIEQNNNKKNNQNRNNNNYQNKTNNSVSMVTNSKIRGLLSMAADIYNQVLDCKEDKLPEDLASRIDYLRVRFIYESGREYSVKQLVEKAEFVEILKEINGSKENYILFYHYMEALVAFKTYMNKNDD